MIRKPLKLTKCIIRIGVYLVIVILSLSIIQIFKASSNDKNLKLSASIGESLERDIQSTDDEIKAPDHSNNPTLKFAHILQQDNKHETKLVKISLAKQGNVSETKQNNTSETNYGNAGGAISHNKNRKKHDYISERKQGTNNEFDHTSSGVTLGHDNGRDSDQGGITDNKPKVNEVSKTKYGEIDGKCLNLIRNKNERFINEAVNFSTKHPRRISSLDSYINITSNCSKYIISKGYIRENISETERRFPIAFSMMVYKHVDQIERLLIAIYRPQNVYCIHIDRKSPDAFYKALKSISLCLPNVFIASNRIKVSWGKYSILEQELVCLKELYNHKAKWRYVINLTGQEYPLKTNYQLVRILDSYKGANDIEGSPLKLNRNRIKGLPKPPHGIVPCKGSLHMTASRGFIDYILHKQTALDFLEWCKKMHSVPDETYFTTLNNNKHLSVPGAYTGEVDKARHYYTRYKVWYSLKDCGSRRFVRGICIQGIADLPTLTTVPHLFVNKFDYEFEPLAYDCLEQWYRHKVYVEMHGYLQFNVTLYEESSFVKHKLM